MSFNTEIADSIDARPEEIQIQAGLDGPEQDVIMSSTVPDFARKLFNLLEDPENSSVISWGPEKDCFTVTDMNALTNTILPRMFNHSNFSSFVRQLNKYEFRKVRKSSQDLYQTWTFKHPHFHGDRPGDLKYITRKASGLPQSEAPRAELSGFHQDERPPQSQSSLEYGPQDLDVDPHQRSTPTVNGLLNIINGMQGAIKDITSQVRTLAQYCKSLDSRMKDIEAILSIRQSDDPMQQEVGQGPNANLPPSSRSGHPGGSSSEQSPPVLQAPSNLLPLFTHLPLNTSGDHRRSQQGNNLFSPEYVTTDQTGPSDSINHPSSSTIIMPSTNLIRAEAPSFHEGLFAGLTHGHNQYDESVGYQHASEPLYAERVESYFPSPLPEEEPEGLPWARATKRLRTSQARHSWPSNLNMAASPNKSSNVGN